MRPWNQREYAPTQLAELARQKFACANCHQVFAYGRMQEHLSQCETFNKYRCNAGTCKDSETNYATTEALIDEHWLVDCPGVLLLCSQCQSPKTSKSHDCSETLLEAIEETQERIVMLRSEIEALTKDIHAEGVGEVSGGAAKAEVDRIFELIKESTRVFEDADLRQAKQLQVLDLCTLLASKDVDINFQEILDCLRSDRKYQAHPDQTSYLCSNGHALHPM